MVQVIILEYIIQYNATGGMLLLVVRHLEEEAAFSGDGDGGFPAAPAPSAVDEPAPVMASVAYLTPCPIADNNAISSIDLLGLRYSPVEGCVGGPWC